MMKSNIKGILMFFAVCSVLGSSAIAASGQAQIHVKGKKTSSSGTGTVTLTVGSRSPVDIDFPDSTTAWQIGEPEDSIFVSNGKLNFHLQLNEETQVSVTSSGMNDFVIVINEDSYWFDGEPTQFLLNDMSVDGISKSDAGSSFTVKAGSARSYPYGRLDMSELDDHQNLTFGLGNDEDGDSAGRVVIGLPHGDVNDGKTPDGIHFSGIKSSNIVGAIADAHSQVRVPVGSGNYRLLDINKTGDNYVLDFYDVGTYTLSGGFYSTSGHTKLVSFDVDITYPNSYEYLPTHNSVVGPTPEDNWEYSDKVEIERTIGSETMEMVVVNDHYYEEDWISTWEADLFYWDYMYVKTWRKSTASGTPVVRYFTEYRQEYNDTSGFLHFYNIEQDIWSFSSYDPNSPTSNRTSTRRKLFFDHADVPVSQIEYESASGMIFDSEFDSVDGAKITTKESGGKTKNILYDETSIATENEPLIAIGQPYQVLTSFADGDLSGTTHIVSEYEYSAELSDTKVVPAKITRSQNGQTISEVAFTYSDLTFGGKAVLQATQAVETSGATGSDDLVTVTRRYAGTVTDPVFRDKTLAIERPDGTQTSFLTEKGTWNATNGTWTKNATKHDVRVVVLNGKTGTSVNKFNGSDVDSLDMEANVSTAQETIRNSLSQIVYEASHVYTSGSGTFSLLSHMHHEYNDYGQLTKSYQRDLGGDIIRYEATYANGRKTSERNAEGAEITYTYNDYGQVLTITKSAASAVNGFAAQSAVTTTYERDSLGRVTKETVGSGNALVTEYDLDSRNRPTEVIAPGGFTTDYTYTSTTTTIDLPGSAGTTVETRFKDGRVKSITGTAQPPIDYAYSFDSGGFLVVEQTNPNDDQATKTVSDWAGRTTLVQTKSWNNDGAAASTPFDDARDVQQEFHYNSNGQLIRVSTEQNNVKVAPDQITDYDSYGRAYRTGVDSNKDGDLDLSVDHSIVETDFGFEQQSGDWFLFEKQYTYPNGNSTAVAIGETYTQVSGLTATDIGYSYSYDSVALNNGTPTITNDAVVTTVELDRADKTVTVATQSPAASNKAYQYSLNGLPVGTKDTAGNLYEIEYDSFGRVLKEIDPKFGETEYRYVLAKNLIDKITAPDSTSTRFGYDDAGRVETVTDNEYRVNQFAYDAMGNTTHSWGYVEEEINEEYTPVRDGATNPIKNVYDAFGRLIEMHTYKTGSWATTTLPSSFSSAGDKTTWTYDSFTGLLNSKTDAASESVSYEYSSIGQMTKRTDARGVVTNYQYFDVNDTSFTGFREKVDYTDAYTDDLTYGYDRIGNITSVAKAGGGSHTYSYRSDLRLDYETLPTADYLGGKLSRNYAASPHNASHVYSGYDYDLSTLTPEAEAVFAYDGTTGRLSSVSGVDSGPFNITYETNSNLIDKITTVMNFNTLTRDRTYHANAPVLTGVKSDLGASDIVSQVDYTYDTLMRRDKIHTTGDFLENDNGMGYMPSATSGSQGLTTHITYNDRDEVTKFEQGVSTSISSIGTAVPGRKFEFAYDDIGNRIDAQIDSDPSTSGADHYTTNSLNQYTQRNRSSKLHITGFAHASTTNFDISSTTDETRRGAYFHGTVSKDETSYSWQSETVTATTSTASATTTVEAESHPTTEYYAYDDNGNLTQDSEWDYVYDAENRLVQMTTRTNVHSSVVQKRIKYAYDYLDRRVKKEVYLESSGSYTLDYYTYFVYDGMSLVYELEMDVGGVAVQAERRYLWGPDFDGGGTGGLLAIEDSFDQAVYAPTYDGNGNVLAIVDMTSNGEIVASYEYSPFGETLRASGPYANKNPFRFATKYADEETGLYYYGYRYYNPDNGRFINRDPIEEQGGINLYGFVGNDPVNGYDYLGLDDDLDDEGVVDPVLEEPGKSASEIMRETALAGSGYSITSESIDAILGDDPNAGQSNDFISRAIRGAIGAVASVIGIKDTSTAGLVGEIEVVESYENGTHGLSEDRSEEGNDGRTLYTPYLDRPVPESAYGIRGQQYNTLRTEEDLGYSNITTNVISIHGTKATTQLDAMPGAVKAAIFAASNIAIPPPKGGLKGGLLKTVILGFSGVTTYYVEAIAHSETRVTTIRTESRISFDPESRRYFQETVQREPRVKIRSERKFYYHKIGEVPGRH